MKYKIIAEAKKQVKFEIEGENFTASLIEGAPSIIRIHRGSYVYTEYELLVSIAPTKAPCLMERVITQFYYSYRNGDYDIPF